METADIGGEQKITVVGKVDPAKLRERVEQKTHKKVELISPQPKKDNNNSEKAKGKENNGGENVKQEKKKESNDQNSKKKSDEKKPKEKEVLFYFNVSVYLLFYCCKIAVFLIVLCIYGVALALIADSDEFWECLTRFCRFLCATSAR